MRTASFLAALGCVSVASAQQASYPVRVQAENIDSGFLDNVATVDQVVWSQDLTIQGDWVQLHFADTHLPGASRLCIHPPSRPDLVQWHDARSIVDYGWYSCQFAGPLLRVELVAAPGTRANRTRIDQAIGLDVSRTIAQDTICGATDDRTLASDPRVCRINAGCTGWLFSEYAVGTAGHCMSTTAGQILHFNVPLSSATGTPQPSHPNDQYAMEAFHPFLNNGVGQDWSVSAAVRNSNTQLYPGIAQGGWFTVVAAPTFQTGQQIRITGCGSGNGTSGSPTWNLVPKTHVAARQSTATATALRYETDTTGGNSGSPVILEATGEVVGVHTHGGCTATGGGNSGTDAVRSDFAAARAQVATLHTLGTVTPFGSGCGGASGVPSLQLAGIPELGRSLAVFVTGLDPINQVTGLIAIGSSSANWNGSPLPADLAFAGLEGCQLFVSIDSTDSLLGTNGIAARSYQMPTAPQMVGVHAYAQFFGLDATAPNTLGAVGSNAIDVRIGN